MVLVVRVVALGDVVGVGDADLGSRYVVVGNGHRGAGDGDAGLADDRAGDRNLLVVLVERVVRRRQREGDGPAGGVGRDGDGLVGDRRIVGALGGAVVGVADLDRHRLGDGEERIGEGGGNPDGLDPAVLGDAGLDAAGAGVGVDCERQRRWLRVLAGNGADGRAAPGGNCGRRQLLVVHRIAQGHGEGFVGFVDIVVRYRDLEGLPGASLPEAHGSRLRRVVRTCCRGVRRAAVISGGGGHGHVVVACAGARDRESEVAGFGARCVCDGEFGLRVVVRDRQIEALISGGP